LLTHPHSDKLWELLRLTITNGASLYLTSFSKAFP
jgi:hypothetical protein